MQHHLGTDLFKVVFMIPGKWSRLSPTPEKRHRELLEAGPRLHGNKAAPESCPISRSLDCWQAEDCLQVEDCLQEEAAANHENGAVIETNWRR